MYARIPAKPSEALACVGDVAWEPAWSARSLDSDRVVAATGVTGMYRPRIPPWPGDDAINTALRVRADMHEVRKTADAVDPYNHNHARIIASGMARAPSTTTSATAHTTSLVARHTRFRVRRA